MILLSCKWTRMKTKDVKSSSPPTHQNILWRRLPLFPPRKKLHTSSLKDLLYFQNLCYSLYFTCPYDSHFYFPSSCVPYCLFSWFRRKLSSFAISSPNTQQTGENRMDCLASRSFSQQGTLKNLLFFSNAFVHKNNVFA